ncbi:hypothetical protein [Macrococcus armenti]|uniref:hypothetical protein n=1 Tax=Macrococcus armenti TaxID=2875764 RepID=UPI001CC92BC4|nr:hypothetical protein [Macrococcus armenti]UBH07859.1 hypothetical protein LAU41_07435 [Macrococcus armenti]
MMKTIKRERQVRLDELLRLVWDGEVDGEKFYDQGNNLLFIGKKNGEIKHADYTCKTDLFTITEEVEIDENIALGEMVIVQTKYFDGHKAKYITRVVNKSIKECKRTKDTTLHEVWAVNGNGIGDLIWSKERGLVD